MVVALVAQTSLTIANWLRRINFDRETMLSIYLVFGKFAEATILLGFGVLSVWNAFSPWMGFGSLWTSILVAALVLLPFWLFHRNKLFSVQIDELNAETTN